MNILKYNILRMEGSVLEVEKNTEKITIKVEGKEWEKALEKSFQKNVKTKKVDGFRKGMVPKEIYINRFGIESLYMDAVDEVLNDAYQKAFDQKTVEPQIQPNMDVKQIDQNSVTIEFTFIGKPEIELGEYKNLKIKKEKVEITEEDIEHELQHLREQFAEIKEKENGVVEENDTAIIDFVGEVDGEVLKNACGENYSLEIGSHTFIPGFEEGLVGMKVKEKKDLHLKFPEKYDPAIAGKDVVFHVTVNEIKTRILPELDEDFFKDLGYDKVTNEEELKEEIKNVLKTQREQDRDDQFLNTVLEKAIENMKVEIPEEIVHDEIHRMIQQLEERLKTQHITLKQYQEMVNISDEELHKNMEPEAIYRIKSRYLLEAVAQKEQIEVTDEEAEKDAEEMANNYGISKEELIKAYGNMEVLKYDSKMRKALKFLQENN